MYYLADILTALRVAGVVAILSLAIGGDADAAGAVLVIFILAELTDAFDGSCARRWPYPDDGKRRWWRIYAEEIDQIADLSLGVVTTLFVGLHLSVGLAWAIVACALFLAIPVQLWRNYRISRIPNEDDDPLRVRVILARRLLYLVGIAALILCLLARVIGANWAAWVLVAALAAVSVTILIHFKVDRLRRDKPKENARARARALGRKS